MMRAVSSIIVTALAMGLWALPAHAADPVVVDLRIDQPNTVTVGDHVRYTIVLEVDEGADVTLESAALPPQVSLIALPETVRAAAGEGREQLTIRFEVAPFVTGDVGLPPLPLRYTQPDGSTGMVETPPSSISVTSVLPPDGPRLPRDLKPQAEIGEPPPTWPLPVAAGLVTALVLLIIAAFVRRRLVRYRTYRALSRVPVLHGPEDIARGILTQTGAAFAADADYVRYYTSLGNAVRYYLTQRYGFPAFALTTHELEDAMLELGLDRWQVRVASGLLTQCDAVVYAQYRPAAERADADLTAAYEIVEISRPADRPLRDEAAEDEERKEQPVS